MFLEFPILITLIRLIIPLIILRYKLSGILLSILADMYDWKLVDLSEGDDYEFYQNWDKALDIYYQFFIAAVVLGLKDIKVKYTALAFLAYRTFGVILFSIFHERYLLLIFPNIFENFVIFYLLFLNITKKDLLFTSGKIMIAVLAVIAIPKLFHEYFQHYLIKQPWEIYDIAGMAGTSGILKEYLNYFVYGGLFYLIPISLMLFLLIKRRNHHK